MEEIEDFVDERQKGWCIHCGTSMATAKTNWDHVPTESLLDRPIPAHTPKVRVCLPCNREFSKDEEYFRVFLSCVLSGSTEPTAQSDPRIQRALARSPALRTRIDAQKCEFTTIGGEKRAFWTPEQDRIKRIILKNARGHAYYEMGEPMLHAPDQVWMMPLASLTAEEVMIFEEASSPGWAEVGSRMLTRQAADPANSWVVVQNNVYRYAVTQTGGLTVRTVIRDYLATEVTWD
ncbi:MAG: hypothetical protein AB7I35_10385 [Ramlibacter sp.]